MSAADSRPPAVLAFCADARPLAPMVAALTDAGFGVELVDTLDRARSSFLASGGQRLLVVSADVAPKLACEAASALRAIDPGLRIVAYGLDADRWQLPAGSVCAGRLHPGSRAGIGVALKALMA